MKHISNEEGTQDFLYIICCWRLLSSFRFSNIIRIFLGFQDFARLFGIDQTIFEGFVTLNELLY